MSVRKGAQRPRRADCGGSDLPALQPVGTDRVETVLDPRKAPQRGYTPEVMGAQIFVTLCYAGAGRPARPNRSPTKRPCHALSVKRFASGRRLG